MEEKDLIKQLAKLQKMSPQDSFVKDTRENLITYMDQRSENFTIAKEVKISLPIRLLKTISQPALAVFLIVSVLFSGGVMSLYAARDSKPGDSLYIAKIINEKTQLALTFDEKKKVRLGLEFAGNRAKELGQVLLQEETEQRDERVETLVNKFKEELQIARMRLARLQTQEDQGRPEDKLPITTKEDYSDTDKVDEDVTDKTGNVFSANLGKDEQGVQVSESNEEEPATTPEVVEEVIEEATEEVIETESSTTIPVASTSEEVVEEETGFSINAQDIIDHLEEILNQEEINDSELSKLEDAIDQVGTSDDKGEVRGESEAATSSEGVVEEEVIEEGEVLGVEEMASSTE